MQTIPYDCSTNRINNVLFRRIKSNKRLLPDVYLDNYFTMTKTWLLQKYLSPLSLKQVMNLEIKFILFL